MKEYLISMTGTITDENGDTDVMDLTTFAEYDFNAEHPTLIYKEYPDQYPVNQKQDEFILNTITVYSDNKITLTKSAKGDIESILILEKDKRHSCVYNTSFGSFEMGFFTTSLVINADENQCTISAFYTTDIDKENTRKHQLEIVLKEKVD